MFPSFAVWEVACFQGSAPSHLPPVRLLRRPALSRFGSRSAFVSAYVSVAHRGGITRSPTPASFFPLSTKGAAHCAVWRSFLSRVFPVSAFVSRFRGLSVLVRACVSFVTCAIRYCFRFPVRFPFPLRVLSKWQNLIILTYGSMPFSGLRPYYSEPTSIRQYGGKGPMGGGRG